MTQAVAYARIGVQRPLAQSAEHPRSIEFPGRVTGHPMKFCFTEEGCQMRITRKIRPAAAVSEHADTDTPSTPSIVRLGDIAELVEGGGNVHADGNEANLFGWR
jgi:hypothetical protein